MSRTALAAAVLGSTGIMLALVILVLAWRGLDDKTTPLIVTIGGALATTATASAAWAKSAEATHEAKHARRSADFNVSKTTALQQDVKAHCGEICPHRLCPLRRPEEQGL